MNSLQRLESRVNYLRQVVLASRGDGLDSRESLIRSQFVHAARLQCLAMMRLQRMRADIANRETNERALNHLVRVTRMVRNQKLPPILAEHVARILERKETT